MVNKSLKMTKVVIRIRQSKKGRYHNVLYVYL